MDKNLRETFLWGVTSLVLPRNLVLHDPKEKNCNFYHIKVEKFVPLKKTDLKQNMDDSSTRDVWAREVYGSTGIKFLISDMFLVHTGSQSSSSL